MARYRVGRTLGRTIYDGDTLIGMMDTPELGAMVVEALNDRRCPGGTTGIGPTGGGKWAVTCTCGFAVADLSSQEAAADTVAWHRNRLSVLGGGR